MSRVGWGVLAFGLAATAALGIGTVSGLSRYDCLPPGDSWTADSYEAACGEGWRRYRRRTLQAAGAQVLGGVVLSIAAAFAASGASRRRERGSAGTDVL